MGIEVINDSDDIKIVAQLNDVLPRYNKSSCNLTYGVTALVAGVVVLGIFAYISRAKPIKAEMYKACDCSL